MKITELSIDIETRSSVDLARCGVYKYAESPDFDILLFGVSVNRGPVTVYDFARGEELPHDIFIALFDPKVQKWAYNAAFERICISTWLTRKYPTLPSLPVWERCAGMHNKAEKVHAAEDTKFLSPSSWRCSMVLAAYSGLPLGLDQVGEVLGLDARKMKEGRDLIRFFCTPCAPSLFTGGKIWNSPNSDPVRWEQFKRYNARDVEVELEIQERLRFHPVPDSVWEEYALDQQINDRGIMIDRRMVAQALLLEERAKDELSAELQEKTGLENPNSVTQMKSYLQAHGIKASSLSKRDVEALLRKVPPDVREVLTLRQGISKSSVSKYRAMREAVCADGRCRGMFQFLGANRSGRWAGRQIQLQNLPRNTLPDLDRARELVEFGDYDSLKSGYPSVPGVLSELIRTALIPQEGDRFIVADFSAIEARVLSYLAGETWRMRVFHEGRDIYCESASRMFGVPVEKHGLNAELRQKGKIAELALGYGGSVGALIAMGALDMGVSEAELQPLVSRWRSSNPRIVSYWWAVDDAVKTAVRFRLPQRVGAVKFEMRGGGLYVTLPSGRELTYVQPRIEPNRFGGESVTYMGVDAQKKWSRLESYGPKFVENSVQAVSRDLLAFAMLNLKDFRIVGHVHDEVIIECPPEQSVEEITDRMSETPPWLPGLELKADGYACKYYRKE